MRRMVEREAPALIERGLDENARQARDGTREAWMAMQGVPMLRLPPSLLTDDIEVALAVLRRRLGVPPT